MSSVFSHSKKTILPAGPCLKLRVTLFVRDGLLNCLSNFAPQTMRCQLQARRRRPQSHLVDAESYRSAWHL